MSIGVGTVLDTRKIIHPRQEEKVPVIQSQSLAPSCCLPGPTTCTASFTTVPSSGIKSVRDHVGSDDGCRVTTSQSNAALLEGKGGGSGVREISQILLDRLEVVGDPSRVGDDCEKLSMKTSCSIN